MGRTPINNNPTRTTPLRPDRCFRRIVIGRSIGGCDRQTADVGEVTRQRPLLYYIERA